jgi:hypothetical protein
MYMMQKVAFVEQKKTQGRRWLFMTFLKIKTLLLILLAYVCMCVCVYVVIYVPIWITLDNPQSNADETKDKIIGSRVLVYVLKSEKITHEHTEFFLTPIYE